MLELELPQFDAKITERDGKKYIFDDLRHKYAALTPEEWVRQNFVHYLTDSLGYPKELLANEVGMHLNGTLKRCDSVLYRRDLSALMIMEYKAPTVSISQKTFNQIVRYNMTLRVRYLIVSNGLNHYCCRVDYDNNSCHFLAGIPAYCDICDD